MPTKMTEKKALWYNRRAKMLGGYATMSPINSNKAADIYYRKSATALLEAFLNASIREVKKHYATIYTANAAGDELPPRVIKSPAKVASAFRSIRGRQMDLFTDKAEQIVIRYVGKAGRMAKKNVQSVLERFFGLKLAIRYNSERYDEMLKIIIRRNVELLRNTASQVIDNVQSIVTDAMTTGRGWADIEHALHDQHEIAENRIKRIARDQTAKATEAVNVMMQRAAGAEYFEWSTSKDERVSTGYGGHKQLDGKIYRYDEPDRYPIIDSYGNRGLPAQRVNCRCTALSVFIADGYRAKWSPSDECYKIVKE